MVISKNGRWTKPFKKFSRLRVKLGELGTCPILFTMDLTSGDYENKVLLHVGLGYL